MEYYFLEKGEEVLAKTGDMIMHLDRYCCWIWLTTVDYEDVRGDDEVWIFWFDVKSKKMVLMESCTDPEYFMEACIKLLDSSHPDNIWNQYWKGLENCL